MIDLKRREKIKKGILGAFAFVISLSFMKNVLAPVIIKDNASGAEHYFGQEVNIDGNMSVKDSIAIPDGKRLLLEGLSGDTYFIKDGAAIKMYLDGTLVGTWEVV